MSSVYTSEVSSVWMRCRGNTVYAWYSVDMLNPVRQREMRSMDSSGSGRVQWRAFSNFLMNLRFA